MLGLFIGDPALGYIVVNYLSGRFSVAPGIDGIVVLGLIITFVSFCVTLVTTMQELCSIALYDN